LPAPVASVIYSIPPLQIIHSPTMPDTPGRCLGAKSMCGVKD
jgi:hypothetical protein